MNPRIGSAVRFRVAVGAVLAMLAGFTPAAVIAAPTGGCTNVQTRGAWTTINQPSLPARMIATVINPRATVRPSSVVTGGVRGPFFAMTGDQIFRSTDTGCTWTPVYTFHQSGVPSDPTNPATVGQLEPTNATIQWIVTAPGGDLVYAGIVDLVIGLGDVTFLAVSRDGGTTWHTTLLAVPTSVPNVTEPMYSVDPVLVSAVDPQVAYLTGIAPSRASDSFYVTKDGGNSWTYLGEPPPGVITDPASASTLWSLKDADTRVSTDYGQTWVPVPRPPAPSNPIRLLDVLHQAGRPAQLLEATDNGNEPPGFVYSGNGGLSWSVVPPPSPILMGLGNYAGAPLLASPQGDILAWINQRGTSTRTTPPPMLHRWFAKQHRWRRLNSAFPPLAVAAGDDLYGFHTFIPIDTSHRYFFGGLQTANHQDPFVVYNGRVPRPV